MTRHDDRAHNPVTPLTAFRSTARRPAPSRGRAAPRTRRPRARRGRGPRAGPRRWRGRASRNRHRWPSESCRGVSRYVQTSPRPTREGLERGNHGRLVVPAAHRVGHQVDDPCGAAVPAAGGRRDARITRTEGETPAPQASSSTHVARPAQRRRRHRNNVDFPAPLAPVSSTTRPPPAARAAAAPPPPRTRPDPRPPAPPRTTARPSPPAPSTS